MALEEVKAKIEGGEHFYAEYDFGGDLNGAIGLFGEELVFAKFRAAAVIDLQSYMRGLIRQEKTSEEVQAAVMEWKPGMKAKGKSTQQKIRDLLSKFDPEEAKAIIEAAMQEEEEDEENGDS